MKGCFYELKIRINLHYKISLKLDWVCLFRLNQCSNYTQHDPMFVYPSMRATASGNNVHVPGPDVGITPGDQVVIPVMLCHTDGWTWIIIHQSVTSRRHFKQED